MYVFTPPVVLSDTVARPVPVTLTASCADVTAKSLITVLPADEILDKSLSADFSAAVTASVNLAVGAMVTSSPVADVVINALAPVSPLMLNVIALVLSFFTVVEPASLPRAIVLLPNAVVASVADFTASSICFLLTAASSVVALPTFLICVLPASIPEPFNLTVLVPSVAVTPAGATVVVFVPSVVDRPPLVIVVVLPAPSVIVEEPPVTVCVLPDPSVNVADVKPVKAFARRIFNVPAPSDTTPMLPVAKSAGVVTPPLMDNTSPCLRTDVAPVSPSNLCSASARACAVLALDLAIASLIAVATFWVVATPFLPAVVPCVEPLAPILPVVSSRTSLPSSTFTVYVFTPPVVLSDTVTRPVPVTLTASCADVTAKSLITVLPADEILDKSLSADFSAAVTASVNLAVGAMVTSSPVADVVMSAFAPVSPLMLNLMPPVVLNFLAVVVPDSLPNETVLSVAPFNASSTCFLLTAASSVVPLATFLISLLPALIPLVVTEIGVAPAPAGVTVIPVGAVVVVLPAASVVVTPPLVIEVVLPAPSVIVEEPPVTVCVLPDPSVNVADVKPVKAFARRIFNVPAPSDTTPMLPVVKSPAFDTPPLMDNTSPCLRTDVVPVSPSNLCSASAKACVVLAFALATASLIAVATFCVVATPFLPAVVPCVEPLAPI